MWVFDIKLGQRAWINGSSVVNTLAVYGALSESGPNSVPSTRYGSAFWDTSRTDPIVFVGNGYINTSGSDFLNDVFALKKTFPTPTPKPTRTPTPLLQ